MKHAFCNAHPLFTGADIMILCIESWKGDTYLTGRKRTISELACQLRQAEQLFDRETDNLIPLLCRMYGWEVISVEPNVVPDYTYDADTGLIF